jgi:hypothetical protein
MRIEFICLELSFCLWFFEVLLLVLLTNPFTGYLYVFCRDWFRRFLLRRQRRLRRLLRRRRG